MIRRAKRAGGVFSVEAGIDFYRTATGSGWSRQASALKRFYGISVAELRSMDELQVRNRMADMKGLIDYERRNVRLAVWGSKKQMDTDGKEDDFDPDNPPRRGRKPRPKRPG